MLKEKSLPRIEAFRSSLGVGRTISQEDYAHAQKVFDIFKCESFQSYMELYVELDVLLLAEFCQFKQNCKEHFGLFPEAYWTLPSFTYDACIYFLEKQGIKLALLKDMEMIKFVEKGDFFYGIHDYNYNYR